MNTLRDWLLDAAAAAATGRTAATPLAEPRHYTRCLERALLTVVALKARAFP